MKKIELTLLVALACFASNNQLFSQEASTMCTHVDDPSENGKCVTYGVPNCASADVATICFDIDSVCGDVTVVEKCTGSPDLDITVMDCCDED